MKTVSISPDREDVRRLLHDLTEYLDTLYPEESNHIDTIEVLSRPNVYFTGTFEEKNLIGIGGVKILDDNERYGEIKRLYVLPEHRGKGAAKMIIKTLENFLLQKKIHLSRIETGIYQNDVFQLFQKLGYVRRAPFGEYEPDPYSIFMEKVLK